MIVGDEHHFVFIAESKGRTKMTSYARIYQDIFFIDGTLRDIYVLGTSQQDWQVLLNFFHSAMYSIELMVEGDMQILPESIEDMFALKAKHVVTLKIDKAYLALHCHFFTSSEIEFDLDPRDFHNEQQVVRLLDFIRTLGNLLNKEIILTPENMSAVLFFRFDPVTEEEQWFFEDNDPLFLPHNSSTLGEHDGCWEEVVVDDTNLGTDAIFIRKIQKELQEKTLDDES